MLIYKYTTCWIKTYINAYLTWNVKNGDVYLETNSWLLLSVSVYQQYLAVALPNVNRTRVEIHLLHWNILNIRYLITWTLLELLGHFLCINSVMLSVSPQGLPLVIFSIMFDSVTSRWIQNLPEPLNTDVQQMCWKNASRRKKTEILWSWISITSNILSKLQWKEIKN